VSGKVQGRHEGSDGAYHEEIAVKYFKGVLITHCNTLQHTATHCNTLYSRGQSQVSGKVEGRREGSDGAYRVAKTHRIP